MSKETGPGKPEIVARESVGPRGFWCSRKITLSNYNPQRKFETEEYGVVHDSFHQARELVQNVVEERIQELRGVKEVETS